MRSMTDEDFLEQLEANSKAEKEREERMLLDDRLRLFLSQCSSRGARYSPGKSMLPNHAQLAKYCGCDLSTIGRIEQGRTTKPPLATVATLCALAGIFPAAPEHAFYAEQKARIADADRWLGEARETRGELHDALIDGILKRRDTASLN